MTKSTSPKTSKLSFSIIIPNLNGQLFLETCIKSLLKSLNQANIKKFEIILVDNASTDNSVNLFCQNTQNKHSRVIINKTNQGFAPAVNQGIKKAVYDYVIVCNNDIKLHPNWFKHIKKQIVKNPQYSTYFGLVLNQDGSKIESTGLKFFWQGKAKNISNGLPARIDNKSNPVIGKTRQIWGASASLVVYKTDIIKKIGAFDNDFFAYEEDVDLAFRLNKRGYKTLFVPDSISYHIGGATSSKMGNFRAEMDAKNWFYIIIKNYPTKKFLKYLPQIIIERFKNLKYLIKQTIKIYKIKSIWMLPTSLVKSYGSFLLNLAKMISKRSSLYINFLDKF